MKTYMQKAGEIKREWHVIDAKGQILGRMATQIATKLMGKHKTTYTPNIDAGDYVIVINAKDVQVTGNKDEKKMYYSHSGFPGGLREQKLAELRAKYPERIIEKAVYNMLPGNRLRSPRMNRLKVYAGAEHNHESQVGASTVA